MKKRIIAVAVGLMLCGGIQGQVPPTRSQVPVSTRSFSPYPGSEAPADLPKFDLNFPGGNPEQLIMSINKQLLDTPVNAIIPEEHRDIRIPEMRLKNVDVQQIFTALQMASRTVFTGHFQGLRQRGASAYTFATTPPVQTNSVWYFYVENPALDKEENACRYYQLAPYLEHGLDINDITTAIKVGYTMLGDEAPPELNFHQETQLLIAVGPPSKLQLIDEALKQLPKKLEPASAGKLDAKAPIK